MMKSFLALLAAATSAHAYFLVGHSNILVTERRDPIVSPNAVSGHSHTILGGSGFAATLSTAQLRASKCTTVPIQEDKSNYWIPNVYFQWRNGTVSALNGGMVTYYLFSDKPGTTTAFPDDFRMISGDPTLRTYNPNSYAQLAVTFLCLDFNGVSKTYNELPRGVSCPSGIRSQINFPSCWDGKNVDSSDHKSHVAFPSDGPDKGSCKDPKYPVTLPRIFLEFYWDAQDWEVHRQDALDPKQPFVLSNGDASGYGYHADFFNGWEKGVLQKVVDNCHCNAFGDASCCAQQGLFTLNKNPPKCTIESTVNEPVLGTLPKLAGTNPITGGAVSQPGGANSAPVSNPGTKDIPPATTTGGTPATSTKTNDASATTIKTSSAPAVTSTKTGGAPATTTQASGAPAATTKTGAAPVATQTSGQNSSSNSGSNGSPMSGNNSSNSGSNSSGSPSNSGPSSGSSPNGSSNSGSNPSGSNSSGPSSVNYPYPSGPQPSSSSSGSGSTSSSSSNSGSNSSLNKPPKCKSQKKPPKCKKRVNKGKRTEALLEMVAEPDVVKNDSSLVDFKVNVHKRSLNRRWGRTMGSVH